MVHKITETALSPNSPFHFLFDLGWAWTWDLDLGLSI